MRVAVLVLACLALTGCPKERKAIEASRTVLAMVDVTLTTVDQSFTELYEEAALAALDSCPNLECYHAEMAKWDKGVKAIKGSKLSLLMLQNSIDGWENGLGQGQFLKAASCFIGSLELLDRTFDELGVQLPKNFLQRALDVASAMGVSGSTECSA